MNRDWLIFKCTDCELKKCLPWPDRDLGALTGVTLVNQYSGKVYTSCLIHRLNDIGRNKVTDVIPTNPH